MTRKPNKYFSLLASALFLVACQSAPLLRSPVTVASQNRFQAQASVDWTSFLKRNAQQVFEEHDLNRNGSIELSEIPHARQTFSSLDLNRDQHLSPAEVLPDQNQLSFLNDYVRRHLKTEGAQVQAEDPQLDTLPTPADLERFQQELAQNAQQHQVLSRPPVLLVPGYAEPSWYFMYGIYRHLKAQGWQVEGINLFPNFASAEEQALKVQARIEEMKQRYGVQQVELVVHSFGGLISRFYIQQMGGADNVRNLVTVATPHHGTYTAFLGPGKSAVQLRPDSDFLKQLNANGFAHPPVKYTSIWSNLDEIVIPPKNAIMPDSTVHYVPWTGHLTIMFSKRTYAFIEHALKP